MEQINKEIDSIMLSCIARNGFEAMPQDYHFLSRYSLLSSYIDIINATIETRQGKHFEDAAKAQAETVLKEHFSISALQEYYEKNGREATKALFKGNRLYWNSFLKVLKSRSHEHTQADKPNS